MYYFRNYIFVKNIVYNCNASDNINYSDICSCLSGILWLCCCKIAITCEILDEKTDEHNVYTIALFVDYVHVM